MGTADMLRFYVRRGAVIFSLVYAVMLLIHAQPYDNHLLRQLLLPEGCPAPCFMGIRPGLTTADDAMKILSATGWVDQYHYEQSSAHLSIKWNDKRPAWLANGDLYGGSALWIQDGVVVQVGLQTNIRLGDIQLVEGQSRFQLISLDYYDLRSVLVYAAAYPDKNMSISVSRDCNQQKGHIDYQDKVYLNYAQFSLSNDLPSTYYNSWLDVIRMSCP